MSDSCDMKFEEIFKISTVAMRLNRSHPNIVRDRFWFSQFIVIIMLTLVSFSWLLNSILFHDIPDGKYAEASKNSIMVIVCVTISFKYFILLYYQETVINLIHIMDQDYEASKEGSDDEKEVVLEYSKRCVKVCKLWLIFASATSAMFPCKAFFLMALHYWNGEFKLVPMFDLTYPSILDTYKDVPVIFCSLFTLCLMFDLYAMSVYIGFDPLVPIFMLHTCGQLELVSRRILMVFENTNEDEILDNLRNIIKKLQDIYKFVDEINTKFTFLYEYNMKTTTFLLPLSAFQIVESLRHDSVNLEFIFFFSSTILHFYIPCYYSDLLMENSLKLRQAIFSCGWEQLSAPRAKRTVIFMLARASRPLVISTIFYPICLDTFAEMCRSSYTIFNLMNASFS